MSQWMQAQKAAATATLMDADGSLGRACGTHHAALAHSQSGQVRWSTPAPWTTNLATRPPPPTTSRGLADSLAGKPVNTPPRGPALSVKYSAG